MQDASGRSFIPKVIERRLKRMSWPTESKAVLTSNRARMELVHGTINVRKRMEKEGLR